MASLTKITTVALSAAALGLVVAGCQPQGGAPTSEATESVAAEATAAEATAAEATAAEATAAVEPTKLMSAAEMSELLVGNTIIGEYDAWNLTWAEYFAPDGTTKLLLRFEGQDDMEATGKHYPNNKGQYCTEDSQLNVYCNNLLPLGDGRYQQVYPGGEKGSIYNQILEGDQIEAFR